MFVEIILWRSEIEGSILVFFILRNPIIKHRSWSTYQNGTQSIRNKSYRMLSWSSTRVHSYTPMVTTHILSIMSNTEGICLCLHDHHRVSTMPDDITDLYMAYNSQNLYTKISTTRPTLILKSTIK